MSTPSHPPGWDYAVIRDHITVSRLGSYLAANDGRLADAFALYEWNIEAAAAVMSTAAMVEVLVRNAFDGALTDWAQRRSAQDWFDVVRLDDQGARDLDAARRRGRSGGREVHGKVVAELTFGFWRYLATSRYLTSLWVPGGAEAFRGGDTDLRRRRAEVDERLQRLLFVRNRAAHHEPIHRRDLGRDLAAAVELSDWISPDAGSWVEARSPLPAVVMKRPAAATQPARNRD